MKMLDKIEEEIILCEQIVEACSTVENKIEHERLALKIANDCFEMLSMLKKQLEADSWKSVEEDMPPEHDTIFAKLKGTDKWSATMFEKASMVVIVVVELGGHYQVMTGRTLDGVWKTDPQIRNPEAKVIYWKPMPQFDPSEVLDE